jgi:hypothetical protein
MAGEKRACDRCGGDLPAGHFLGVCDDCDAYLESLADDGEAERRRAGKRSRARQHEARLRGK